MIVYRCSRCSFEYTQPGICPMCNEPAKQTPYTSNVGACRGIVSAIAINLILVIAALLVWGCIASAGEPCQNCPPRIEYYTLDNGTQVPFSGDYTAYHEYRRPSTPVQTIRPQAIPQTRRAIADRPGVRQAPFISTTRHISARVAVQVSTTSAGLRPQANTFTPARDAQPRGDTSRTP